VAPLPVHDSGHLEANLDRLLPEYRRAFLDGFAFAARVTNSLRERAIAEHPAEGRRLQEALFASVAGRPFAAGHLLGDAGETAGYREALGK
jgi:hypothetical protein